MISPQTNLLDQEFIPIWITKLLKCFMYPSNYFVLWVYLTFENDPYYLPFLLLVYQNKLFQITIESLYPILKMTILFAIIFDIS